MRGCTRLTRAHDVHNDWIARSMQFADQIRQDPAAPGLQSADFPRSPPRLHAQNDLHVRLTFAHLPLGLVNMLTLGLQFAVIEPIEVVSLVFFPWFFDNKHVARVRQIYKDYFL